MSQALISASFSLAHEIVKDGMSSAESMCRGQGVRKEIWCRYYARHHQDGAHMLYHSIRPRERRTARQLFAPHSVLMSQTQSLPRVRRYRWILPILQMMQGQSKHTMLKIPALLKQFHRIRRWWFCQLIQLIRRGKTSMYTPMIWITSKERDNEPLCRMLAMRPGPPPLFMGHRHPYSRLCYLHRSDRSTTKTDLVDWNLIHCLASATSCWTYEFVWWLFFHELLSWSWVWCVRIPAVCWIKDTSSMLAYISDPTRLLRLRYYRNWKTIENFFSMERCWYLKRSILSIVYIAHAFILL